MATGLRWRLATGAPSGYGDDPAKGGPTAGGHVHTINENGLAQKHVAPGRVLLMDCGGSFSAGADLATDANGRAVAAQSGDVKVAEALEGASGAGDEAWVVMTTQREV